MARFLLSVLGVFVMVAALGVPAQGAVSAREPPRDSVVAAAGFTRSGSLPGPFFQISINAESDALGGNPSGQVSFVVGVPPFQFVQIGGPATCLGVNQNRAVIGIIDQASGLGPVTVFVIDSILSGDIGGFGAARGPTDCSTQPGISTFDLFGGASVFDTPSKDQCKDGGWRNYTDATREPFTRQSDCITFALGLG
jgi:hypothetical protein